MENNKATIVYGEVLKAYPYNGLARILRLKGENGIPESFGGSCREQVKKLMDKLGGEEEWKFRIPYDPMLVHSTLIARDPKGEQFFMDLSLMMMCPVRIDFIPVAPATHEVVTFPFIREFQGKGELSIDGKIICVRWEIPTVRPDGSIRLVEKKKHRFSEELDPNDFLPSEDKEAVSAELQWNAWQRSMYWNVLDSEAGSLTTVRIMANGTVEIRENENPRIIRKDDTEYFDRIMKKISRIVGATQEEVKEFLELGSKTFVKMVQQRQVA